MSSYISVPNRPKGNTQHSNPSDHSTPHLTVNAHYSVAETLLSELIKCEKELQKYVFSHSTANCLKLQ